MKRLFTALKIQPDARFLETFGRIRQELRGESIKWVEGHNIHITLKFFGETEETRIPAIGEVLSRRASVSQVFSFRLKGLGVFGSSYAPRVVWAGIEPYAELSHLMKQVHDDLALIGFSRDRQNLVPHLTLGRVKFLQDKIRFQRTLDCYGELTSEPIRVHEMVLYESVLRQQGPIYIPQQHYLFAESELP